DARPVRIRWSPSRKLYGQQRHSDAGGERALPDRRCEQDRCAEAVRAAVLGNRISDAAADQESERPSSVPSGRRGPGAEDQTAPLGWGIYDCGAAPAFAGRRGGGSRRKPADAPRARRDTAFEPKNAAGFEGFAARFLDPARTQVIALNESRRTLFPFFHAASLAVGA